MVQSTYEENLNFKKVRQPFDDLRTENCSRGPEGVPSIADRMNKMEKILALVNSPYEGEALSAARLAIKLSRAWGIDLGLLQDSSVLQLKSVVDRGVQSGSGHFFSSHTVQKHHVTECPDLETPRRTCPTFVKAHMRRHGGPPFPVRPHRRRRRART